MSTQNEQRGLNFFKRGRYSAVIDTGAFVGRGAPVRGSKRRAKGIGTIVAWVRACEQVPCQTISPIGTIFAVLFAGTLRASGEFSPSGWGISRTSKNRAICPPPRFPNWHGDRYTSSNRIAH